MLEVHFLHVEKGAKLVRTSTLKKHFCDYQDGFLTLAYGCNDIIRYIFSWKENVQYRETTFQELFEALSKTIFLSHYL